MKFWASFLRGQLMVMMIMGLVYGLGLMLVGLDSGFAIGMIAGILVFIPYLGAFTGLLLATVAALLTIWLMAGLVDGLGCIRCRTILGKFFSLRLKSSATASVCLRSG